MLRRDGGRRTRRTRSGPVVVFAGPSLRPDDQALLDAQFRPPAQLGDVLRAAAASAAAIALIDGFFERTPAVFHKEILWALATGTHVYGAASMGALRAAELAPFGMRGVGVVYEWFRCGELEDDDEVAVLHGPARGGYRASSVAMVDIRWAIGQATAAGAVAPPVADAVIRAAKALFYADRTYPAAFERASAGGAEADDLARLDAWLTANPASRKADDAALLLRTVAADRRAGALDRPPRTVPFAPTVFWERVVATERDRMISDEVDE